MKEQINIAKETSTIQKRSKSVSNITFVDNHPKNLQRSELKEGIINNATTLQRGIVQLAKGVKGLTGGAKKTFVDSIVADFGIPIEKVNTYIDSDEFENKENFREWIRYYQSYITKPIGDRLTKQELYFTTEGWRRIKSGINADAAPVPASQQVKIYRTMPLSRWNALRDGSTTDISGHLGDYAEALSYLAGEQGAGKEVNVLVELPLKMGQENSLFSPANLTLPKGALKPVLKNIFDSKAGFTQNASTNEGIPPTGDGRLGLKSEKRGMAGFSIAIGNSPARSTKLMNMIDIPNMGVLGYKEPLTLFRMLNQRYRDYDHANAAHIADTRAI